jgi:hypothetical protein
MRTLRLLGLPVAIAALAGASPPIATGDECTNSQYRTLGGTFKTRNYDYFINRKRFAYKTATISRARTTPSRSRHTSPVTASAWTTSTRARR